MNTVLVTKQVGEFTVTATSTEVRATRGNNPGFISMPIEGGDVFAAIRKLEAALKF